MVRQIKCSSTGDENFQTTTAGCSLHAGGDRPGCVAGSRA